MLVQAKHALESDVMFTAIKTTKVITKDDIFFLADKVTESAKIHLETVQKMRVKSLSAAKTILSTSVPSDRIAKPSPSPTTDHPLSVANNKIKR